MIAITICTEDDFLLYNNFLLNYVLDIWLQMNLFAFCHLLSEFHTAILVL